MSSPVQPHRILLKGRFVNADGSPTRGRLTLDPTPERLVDTYAGLLISGEAVVIELSDQGAFATQVAATDDPDIVPTGFTYRVVEPGGKTYDISVPKNAPAGVLDLVTVVPAATPNPGTVQLMRGRGITSVTLVGSNLVANYDDGTSTTIGPPVPDGSITDAKVSGSAAISMDKLAETSGRKAMTAAERTKLAGLPASVPSSFAAIATTGSASDLATGTVAMARLPVTGTPTATTYWRGDGTWASVATTSSGLPVYNVKDTTYGAVGNGTTPDHVAIQAALTAAGAGGGGIVYLPPGVYLVNKYLAIPSNVTLSGAGMGVSIIRCGATFWSAGGVAPDGGGYSVLQATGAGRTNIAITDLTVDGAESLNRTALAASSVRINSYLVDMRSVTGLRIERVATRNSWTYNIMVIDTAIFTVAGCDVQAANTTGVYDQLDGIHILGSNKGRVIHNYVDNGIGSDADDALVCHVITGGNPCFDIVYANNVARGGAGGNGIQLAGDTQIIRDIVVTNNVFWGCRAGIFTNWYSTTGNQPIRSVTISNNTIRDCTTLHPIWIHRNGDGKWEDITISGNVIDGYGSSTSTAMAIYVEGGGSSRGITISHNVMRNGYSRGIYLAEGTLPVRDFVIASNIIDLTAAVDTTPFGIITGGALDGTIIGNVIVGKATGQGYGIYINGTAANVATNITVTGNRIRQWLYGLMVTNGSGSYATNTLIVSNNTQGNSVGIQTTGATVTNAANI